MAEISQTDRALAIAELERIARTLMDMSMWVDDDSADRERASICLEDASKYVMAGAFLLERADRVRVADLAHRRMSPRHQLAAQDGQQPAVARWQD